MLKIDSVSFSYGDETIINNLSMELPEGAIFAILGDSGSGKSTLLRLIAGLEKVKSGKIYVDGRDVSDMPPEKRKVGMIFQDYSLFPHMTVYENVGFSINKKRNSPEVDDILNTAEIYRHKDKYPHELSGGEQQRVALARAICYKPKVLLMDEPFSNLDQSLKAMLREKVFAILKNYNTTAILVTHDREDADALAKKIYYMKKGSFERVD